MRNTFKQAFLATLPVMTGYLVLGFGFGIILRAGGYSVLLAFLMSFLIYAGSMQYVAVGLLTGGASFLTVALTTLLVNFRHLFYGISMLEKYQHAGIRKAYLIFSLTDETYSLLCHDNPRIAPERQNDYRLTVSVLDHCYWVIGSVLGAVIGSVVKFNSTGIDFALTALFITIFLEQWLSKQPHRPAIVGVLVSVLCLLIFGSESFLIPTMLIITLLLCLQKEVPAHD